MELLNEKDLRYQFKYPESIKKVVVLGFVNLCPWWILDSEWSKKFSPIVQSAYPKRKLIPFATRQDNDDTACFEVDKGEEVQIIHVGASVGWEQRGVYPDFAEWLKAVLEDTKDADLDDCIRGLKKWRKVENQQHFLCEKDLFYGFQYPESFKKAVVLGLVNICPWSIMDAKRVNVRLEGLKTRYPNRQLIPFAERQDNDDIACFEIDKGEEIQLIHDFASQGWEQVETFKNLIEWFKIALDDMNVWGELIDCIESIESRK